MEIPNLLEELKIADIGARDEDLNTALHMTLNNETLTQKEIIVRLEVLLERGLFSNIRNKYNETVLQLAVAKRLKEVVDFLISRKINMNAAAFFFIEDEYIRFFRLTAKENISDELASEIERIENESANYVEWLISKGFDFNCENESIESALYMAIKRNLQHILPVLLRNVKDIKSLYEEKKTLLHLFLDNNSNSGFDSIAASWYSRRYAVDIVKILLDRGISVDAEDYHKCTPIQTAFKNKADLKVMEILLAQSTKINHRNHGETLLQMVIKSFVVSNESEIEYHLKILDSVIINGASVNELNEYDEYGRNVLCYAVAQQNVAAIEFLQENGADFSVITKCDENLLHLLVHRYLAVGEKKIDGDAEIALFNLLISKGCQVNAKDKDGKTPLYKAVFYNNLTIARKLIEHGAEVNCKGNDVATPLQIAVSERGNLHMIMLLAGNGADFSVITKNNENLLHLLVKRPRYLGTDNNETEMKLFNLLISKGCEVNAKDKSGKTPLHEAVDRDNVRTILKLIENGAEFNVTTKSGETLIRHLLKSSEYMKIDEESQVKLFNLIVTEDCQINAKDETGTSLIHLATKQANVAIVRSLIERGADVNCRNNEKETPLHFSTTNSAAAKVLLEHGAYVNAKDSQGRTALHKAAERPKLSRFGVTVSTLLEYAANVNAKDVRGMTALRLALIRDRLNHELYDRYHFEDEDHYYYTAPEYYGDEVTKFASWEVVLLTWHSIKLKIVDLPWDSQIDGRLGDFEMYAGSKYCRNQHYQECLAEVEKLKRTFIYNRVSLYSLLHMVPRSRCIYVNNEKLQKLVQSPLELEKKFPKYFVFILANYREANARKFLLGSAKEAWMEITKIALPDLCLECIFSFLSNSNLFCMIEKD